MKIEDFKRLLGSLKKPYQKIYNDYKFLDILSQLDLKTINRIHPYNLDVINSRFKLISQMYDNTTFESIRKIVLLEALIKSWNDIFSDKYPKSIQEEYQKNFNRFFELSTQEEGWGNYKDDVYWKDLSIARQQMFPLSSGVVEAFSGFGFKQGLNRDLFQNINFIKLILTSGGRKGYYQIHTHTPLLSNFNEKGWFESYIQIAEMLSIHEKIKGVFRGSWFCDPAIKRISPHLKYIQEIPVKNGAKLFHVGEDLSGNAFSKSRTRKTLYNEGKYTPQLYLLIWPRRKLISWADQAKKY